MLELKAESRSILGKKVSSLRQTGFIPAVLYGHNKKPVPVTVSAKEFDKLFKEAGETTLVSLSVDGKNHNVFIHDMEKGPLDSKIIHVDFFEVRMDEKIKAKVPFVFIGESQAIKADGGILVRAMHEVEIEALPQDMPKEISVDISSLKTFEDKIRIQDLVIGKSVKVLTHLDETVALVAPPRSDKEIADLEAKPAETAAAEVKVVGEEEKAAAAVASAEEAQETAK